MNGRGISEKAPKIRPPRLGPDRQGPYRGVCFGEMTAHAGGLGGALVGRAASPLGSRDDGDQRRNKASEPVPAGLVLLGRREKEFTWAANRHAPSETDPHGSPTPPPAAAPARRQHGCDLDDVIDTARLHRRAKDAQDPRLHMQLIACHNGTNAGTKAIDARQHRATSGVGQRARPARHIERSPPPATPPVRKPSPSNSGSLLVRFFTATALDAGNDLDYAVEQEERIAMGQRQPRPLLIHDETVSHRAPPCDGVIAVNVREGDVQTVTQRFLEVEGRHHPIRRHEQHVDRTEHVLQLHGTRARGGHESRRRQAPPSLSNVSRTSRNEPLNKPESWRIIALNGASAAISSLRAGEVGQMNPVAIDAARWSAARRHAT